jgi:hypothetical protein
MSGELKVAADWTPPGPVVEQPKAEKMPPANPRDILLRGLLRFAVISVGLSGGLTLLATLFVWQGSAAPARVFPLTFFVGGAVLGIGAVMGGTGTNVDWYWDRGEREEAFNYSFVYVVFAAVLIAVGVALDAYL